jgi:hypothetical protein
LLSLRSTLRAAYGWLSPFGRFDGARWLLCWRIYRRFWNIEDVPSAGDAAPFCTAAIDHGLGDFTEDLIARNDLHLPAADFLSPSMRLVQLLRFQRCITRDRWNQPLNPSGRARASLKSESMVETMVKIDSALSASIVGWQRNNNEIKNPFCGAALRLGACVDVSRQSMTNRMTPHPLLLPSRQANEPGK